MVAYTVSTVCSYVHGSAYDVLQYTAERYMHVQPRARPAAGPRAQPTRMRHSLTSMGWNDANTAAGMYS